MLNQGVSPYGEGLIMFINVAITEMKHIFISVGNIIFSILSLLNISISIPETPFQIQLNLSRPPLVFFY